MSMDDPEIRVLVVNAGSSTLKLAVLDDGSTPVVERTIDPWDGEDTSEIGEVLAAATGGPIDAVGHRVVHGGPDLRQAVLIDDEVAARLQELVELAPLHQARSLQGISAVRRVLPSTPAVACFDTTFHTTLAAAASTYAVPEAWRDRWPIRRYGFHGLSHAYAVGRAGELGAGPRVVSCHLGSGASLCASRDGRAVDTTMGFTPLEGLVMATRSGTVDPGLVLWLVRVGGLAAEEVEQGLENRAGLAGLGGGSGDMRELLAAVDDGDDRAMLALDVYVHRLRRELGAMSGVLSGLDVLVFTGGIGEGSAVVRARATAELGYLGVAIDPAANQAASGDADITASGAPARTLVVTAREDLEIAHQTRAAIRGGPARS